MNSTNNNSFEIAAKKVFSDLYALIKEDEKEYNEYKIYENNVSSLSFKITEDELNKINSKEDMTEVLNTISSYDKELVSTIKKLMMDLLHTQKPHILKLMINMFVKV